MRNSLVVLLLIILSSISFSNCSDSDQPTQSEIQSQGDKGTGSIDTTATKVTGLSVTASGPTTVNLSWNSVPNATTYWIHRDDYVPAIISGTKYSDDLVKGGTTYTYAITAVVNGVLGTKSDPVTITTPH